MSTAWKALLVLDGLPLGVDGAGVNKGQMVWQVVPILPPSEGCGQPFLLLEQEGSLFPPCFVSCCCCLKRQFEPQRPPEKQLAVETLHPFETFLQRASCAMAQTLPQYPVSELPTLEQLGLAHGRFKMPAGDGNLAPAPRERLPVAPNHYMPPTEWEVNTRVLHVISVIASVTPEHYSSST